MTSGSIQMHDPTLIPGRKYLVCIWDGLNEAGMRLIKSTDNMKTWTRMTNLFTTPLSWWSTYVPGHEQNQWAPISPITMVNTIIFIRFQDLEDGVSAIMV